MRGFDRALAFVLQWEGGLADDPRDPGGLTNHGISQRAYPDLDIRALTKEQVVEIYRRDYWTASRCEEMAIPVALVVFDGAVNHGVKQMTRCLQRAVGVDADGVLGAVTMAAAIQAWSNSPELVLRDVCHQRLMHYTSLRTWEIFGGGWSKRLLDCLVTATRMLER